MTGFIRVAPKKGLPDFFSGGVQVWGRYGSHLERRGLFVVSTNFYIFTTQAI